MRNLVANALALSLALLSPASSLAGLPAWELGLKNFLLQDDQAPPPPAPAAPKADAVQEATLLALELGLSPETTFEPDQAKVKEIETALKEIRAKFSTVAPYLDERPLAYSITLGLTPDADKIILAAMDAAGAAETLKLPTSSLAECDALSQKLGGALEAERLGQRASLRITFPKVLDLRKVAKLYAGFPGVRWAEMDGAFYMGDNWPVKVLQNGSGWRVVFHHGWGDCMAGCINNEYWFFSYESGQAREDGYYRKVFDGAGNRYVETGAMPWPLPK